MSVNHVSAHRYGDRQALGIYRIVATVLMFILFVFLTIYEVAVNKNRFYLTFAWYVSAWTFGFFAISLTNMKAYFGEKAPVAGNDANSTHPFSDWKTCTSYYSLALQAAVHLVVLENLQNYNTNSEVDVLLVILRYVPLSLLVGDFFANRIYLPLTIIANYSYMSYSLAALAYLVRSDIEQVFKMPELRYFSVQPECLAWSLPAIVMMGCYFVTRIKFWYIDEGDEVFNFSAWAKQANERMDWIECDGVREEENFHFLVDGAGAADEEYDKGASPGKPKQRRQAQAIDYSDPK